VAVNLIILLVLVALAGASAWLMRRSWRSKRKFLKWAGAVLSSLATVLLTLVSVLVTLGFYSTYSPRGNPVVEETVSITPERVARGQHIAEAICSSCHSLDDSLPLSGGKNIAEDIPMPLGNLTPPNLTPAGNLKGWSDGEILRAVREGTSKNGHLMPVMSVQGFREFSDEDLRSVIAYVRSQPPVVHETPGENLTVLALAFLTLGFIPTKPVPEPGTVASIPVGATVEYGAYVTRIIGCSECHGEELTGGKGGLLPKGPDLRVVKGWSEEQFVKTLRTGEDPSGHVLDADDMPWKFIGRLTDSELSGLYKYLISLN